MAAATIGLFVQLGLTAGAGFLARKALEGVPRGARLAARGRFLLNRLVLWGTLPAPVFQTVQAAPLGPDLVRAPAVAVAGMAAFLAPYAPLFRRRQSRHSLERYVTGLLTDLPRKNCDTIAAAVAGTSTERLQYLLTDADWAPLALDAARVRRLVGLSPPGGLLVLDDTGLPMQGRASVGVARQYSGTLGKVATCQVVVTAEYVEDAPASSTPLHWPVSARLYLPERWAGDPARRRRARVPQGVAFRTKPDLGLEVVDRARAWGVPFPFVVADAASGDSPCARSLPRS
jgi:SRSO17 transposase